MTTNHRAGHISVMAVAVGLPLLAGRPVMPPGGSALPVVAVPARFLAERSEPDHQAAAVRTPDEAPASMTVYPGHPRLIVGGWRGITVEAMRRVCADPAMQGECERIGGRHLLDDAMRYLLAEDAAAAARTRSTLLAGLTCGDGYEQTPAGGYALAYDWVWPTLSPADRAAIETTLAECGTNIARSLRGNGPHLWHGFTSQAAALALVSLALDDHPARDTLRSDAVALFRQQALAAYAVTGGAWPEGYSYLRSHFFSGDPPYQYVIDALRAWDSAVEQDHPRHASIFETIASEEGDWLRGLAWHVVYGTLNPSGDGEKPTLLRGGDMPTGQAYPTRQYRPFVDAVARAYADQGLRRWGEQLAAYWPLVSGEGTYHPIHRYSLPYTLPVDVPTGVPAPAAAARIWGRDDLGYVITRSWWGTDETVVTYRAGKWFTGHQHMDQGHFDIWHRGPLAVDAGVYAAWGSEHREAWYSRAVAHNTLLIHRDGETFEQHPALQVAVNDDGQRIHPHNRRGCAQCIQSVDEWRANLGAGLHFEAGRIDAFWDGLNYTVIASDLTSAYNSTAYTTPGNVPKVDSVQRDITFVRPWLLLVLDRVRTRPGTAPPRFTLHLPQRPDLTANLPVTVGTGDDGILAGPASDFGFRVANAEGGYLYGRTVVPTDVHASIIGGPNHRYWVDGANRASGAEGLEGAPAEPGTWRVEVAPAGTPGSDGPADSLLLHALTIGEADTTELRVTPLPVDLDPAAPEPVLALWCPDARLMSAMGKDLLVVASGAVPRAPVRFVEVAGVPSGMAHLLLEGAVPNATYRLGVRGVPLFDVAVDAEGVTALFTPAVEGLTVALCPAAPGAGETWRHLCAAPLPGTITPATATATNSPAATATTATPRRSLFVAVAARGSSG